MAVRVLEYRAVLSAREGLPVVSAVGAREILATPGHVGLLALVPLGRDGEQEEMLGAAVQRIRESGVTPDVRADLLAAASVFAGLRSDAELVQALVRRDEMKESVIYQEIFQEGKTEGKAEGQADAIVHVLERRFGDVPPALRARIFATHDADSLAALLDLALTTASLADVERRLPSR